MQSALEFVLFGGLIFVWSGLVTLFALRLKSIQDARKTIDEGEISA